MRRLTISVLACLFAGVLGLYGQTRESLERERRDLEKSIKLTNELLAETQKSAETSLNQLVILNSQIQKRQSLIRIINNETQLLTRQILSHSKVIEELSQELEELKDSYAKMIYYAYRNQNSYQRLMFIFSSDDFNQAYLRLKYLQQYARHRQIQAERIVETRDDLDLKIAELKSQKRRQEALLAEEKIELSLLSEEKEQQTQVVEELKYQEAELKKQMEEHQKMVSELDNAIAKIIEEERRRAAERARAEGKPAGREYELTPEEIELSKNFASNRGKLPWPVERGVITAGFGERDHPVLRGIKIQNNGVDIATVEGGKARAIFEGTVSRVIYIPGSNYSVIIRHGEFRSVYSNLSQVSVQNGQKISTRQELGVVATNSREAKTEINLQIWRETEKLNPAQWIARQN